MPKFKIMTACDMNYLRQFGPALVTSAALANNNLHIEVSCPADGFDKEPLIELLKLAFCKLCDSSYFTITRDIDLDVISDDESLRTAYACRRFQLAEQIMQRADTSLFIIDTDCMIMKHLNEPDCNLGLFLREPLPGTIGYEALGTKVAAGAVYYHRSFEWFAREVREHISTHEFRWFADQVALSAVYEKHKNSMLGFQQISPDLIDWEFKEGTTVWTGKGPRKYENPKYLEAKQKFETIFKNAIQ